MVTPAGVGALVVALLVEPGLSSCAEAGGSISSSAAPLAVPA